MRTEYIDQEGFLLTHSLTVLCSATPVSMLVKYLNLYYHMKIFKLI
jgi:hypothetical protein